MILPTRKIIRMICVRLTIAVLVGFLLVQWACVAAQGTSAGKPAGTSSSQSTAGNPPRELAPVIAATGKDAALTKPARHFVDQAAGNRISTRIYLADPVDPTNEFRFDQAAVRSHIARNAPSRQVGCLFIVDLEGEYFKALRTGSKEEALKVVDLFVQAIRTAKEARPGEPVIVYGIPNRNWRNTDLSVLAPVFARVDYINVNAYAGFDNTQALYRKRIDTNVAMSKEIADQYGLELIAHVNPRYKDEKLVPMDDFIKGMEYLKSKGVDHVVYWQPPWKRIESLAADGKPASMSDDEWKSTVEQCYLCALLKVFDPENPVSKTCSTKLPDRSR